MVARRARSRLIPWRPTRREGARWSSRSGRSPPTSSRCATSRARSRSSSSARSRRARERRGLGRRRVPRRRRGALRRRDRRAADSPGSTAGASTTRARTSTSSSPSPAYLETAAERADDPTRASFLGARDRVARASRGLERRHRRGSRRCPTTCGTNGCARTSRRRGCTAGTSFARPSSATTSSFVAMPACTSRWPRPARRSRLADHSCCRARSTSRKLVRSVPTPDGFVEAWDRVVADPDIESRRCAHGDPRRVAGPAVSTGDEALSTSSATTNSPGSAGRIPRSSGDARRVSPLTAPLVMPATICRLKKMYMISGGIVMSRMSVNSRFHWLSVWLWKLYSVELHGRVRRCRAGSTAGSGSR